MKNAEPENRDGSDHTLNEHRSSDVWKQIFVIYKENHTLVPG